MADAHELLVSAIQEWIARGEPTHLHGTPVIDGQDEPISNALSAARKSGASDVMAFMRSRADEWRNGKSSVKGFHLPLKHVYRWLRESEECWNEPEAE